ncbi:TldD/PmbA family protein [Alphaproteobacteria bacterium]|jgi:PmbA protein|nr:TldD/PmbA family protein [Alphaproteobacteria bacterium]MBT5798310.1 TldD/PmbA family protein [Alphaproteobacteria bacterium]MDC0394853.1 TldD/PmbA family protein [Alphaproteobacteria bacterium]
MDDSTKNIIFKLLETAKSEGADAAEATLVRDKGVGVEVRLGKFESVEHADNFQIGLRVFTGQQSASISTGKVDSDAIKSLCQRAVAMARLAPADPFARLATKQEQASELPTLELYDPTEITADALTEMALKCETAALDIEGITNSDGASAGQYTDEIAIATSTGFLGEYQRSSFSISASVIAEQNGRMESDYDFSSTVFAEDLMSAEKIGASAGNRTINRLGARSATTGQFPVLFDTRVSKSLTGHLVSAVNGASIARGTSFLKDKMGEVIANKLITVTDDPLRNRGLGSRSFDGETLPVKKQQLIKDGVLQSWLLDLASASQLGLTPTGNASRSLSGPPSPGTSNCLIENGELSVEELISDIKQGFLVTELIGSSVSLTTGDYSRGASGFWIENGEIAYAVTEATIAGNLKEMFFEMTPANDIDLRFSTSAPTIRVDGMTIAGG